MINEMHVSWRAPLAPFSRTLVGKTVLRDLRRLLKKDEGDYHPPRDKIFAAFEATPFDRVRVVIIGQDPYPDKDKATGLAFSMPMPRPNVEIKLSTSIKGIYRALQNDFQEVPPNGNLNHWANQDVLLLNRVLTFRRCNRCKVNIHMHQGWEYFTEAVVKALNNDKSRRLHFMLWGADARKLEKHIDKAHHHVVPDVRHPAAPPLSRDAVNRGAVNFETCGHFLTVNNALGEESINWIRDPNQ